MLGRELCGNVSMKTVHDRAVGHITVAELELKLGDTLVGV
jgi:hypothetical protein